MGYELSLGAGDLLLLESGTDGVRHPLCVKPVTGSDRDSSTESLWLMVHIVISSTASLSLMGPIVIQSTESLSEMVHIVIH